MLETYQRKNWEDFRVKKTWKVIMSWANSCNTLKNPFYGSILFFMVFLFLQDVILHFARIFGKIKYKQYIEKERVV
jgi:hypothetical protein